MEARRELQLCRSPSLGVVSCPVWVLETKLGFFTRAANAVPCCYPAPYGVSNYGLVWRNLADSVRTCDKEELGGWGGSGGMMMSILGKGCMSWEPKKARTRLGEQILYVRPQEVNTTSCGNDHRPFEDARTLHTALACKRKTRAKADTFLKTSGSPRGSFLSILVAHSWMAFLNFLYS